MIQQFYRRLVWWVTRRARPLAPAGGTGMSIGAIDPRYLAPSDVDRLTGIAYR